jgi:hypothetical protein
VGSPPDDSALIIAIVLGFIFPIGAILFFGRRA